MYAYVTQTVPAKKWNPKPFFARIYKKNIEDLYLFTEKSEICISSAI